MTAALARSSAFQCDEWSGIAANASRASIAAERHAHDRYQGSVGRDFARAVEALLTYRIFPPHRMVARICTGDGRVAVGATIVQRVIIGPVALETAVRVIEVETNADGASFVYATLQGHPERGIASFAVNRQGADTTFEAQAWSRSGTWLTLLGRPVSRTLQRSFTREAVRSFCA